MRSKRALNTNRNKMAGVDDRCGGAAAASRPRLCRALCAEPGGCSTLSIARYIALPPMMMHGRTLEAQSRPFVDAIQ